MKKSLLPLLLLFIAALCWSCGNTSNKQPTQEYLDSIAAVRQDSIRIADSIAVIQKAIADSIAIVKQKEHDALVAKLSKKFRFQKDEFENKTWVYHNSTTKYTNRNSIHLYFQTDNENNASNLRFRVQYEAGEWLFINNMIFNIDGENIRFIPNEMETDCGYGGRIWEWCDEPASDNTLLVQKICNAKTVKIKFNGKQYYDTKRMSAKELKAFKETLDYYKSLGGYFL